jgi:organic hydroperoxide reductase OsmC/OhrA
MLNYPMTFETQASAAHGTGSPWSAKSTEYEIAISIPPEFSGPGGAMSPEDLFAHALTNCFLATFKVLAENSKVTFENISVKSRLIVDRDDQKRPCMQACHLSIQLTAPSDENKAKRLMEKALQSGFILNSVKTIISHDIEIT